MESRTNSSCDPRALRICTQSQFATCSFTPSPPTRKHPPGIPMNNSRFKLNLNRCDLCFTSSQILSSSTPSPLTICQCLKSFDAKNHKHPNVKVLKNKNRRCYLAIGATKRIEQNLKTYPFLYLSILASIPLILRKWNVSDVVKLGVVWWCLG